MDAKERSWQIDFRYAVRLRYEGLSIDELSKILDVITRNKGKWLDLEDPIIKRDREYFDDGWVEPIESWNITIIIHDCGGIDLDSYNKYFSTSVTESFSEAEELAAEINKVLGID